MGGPGDRFDRSGVVAESPLRFFGEFVPHHEFVVVATGGELTVVGVPAETADFLFVSDELAEVLVWLSDVAVIDEAVSGAGS